MPISNGQHTLQWPTHRADRTSLAIKVCEPQQIIEQKHSQPLPSLQTFKLINLMNPASQVRTSIQKLSNWSTSSSSPMSSTCSTCSSVFAAAAGGTPLVPSPSELPLMGSFTMSSKHNTWRDAVNKYLLQTCHTAEDQARISCHAVPASTSSRMHVSQCSLAKRAVKASTLVTALSRMMVVVSALCQYVFCLVLGGICR